MAKSTPVTYAGATAHLLTSDGALTPTGVRAMQLYNAYVNAGLPPMSAAQLIGGQLVEDPNLNPLQMQGKNFSYQPDATVSDLLGAFVDARPGIDGVGISQWTSPSRQRWVQNYLADNFDSSASAFAASAQATIAELNQPAFSNVLSDLKAVNLSSTLASDQAARSQAARQAQSIALQEYENPKDNAIDGPNYNNRLNYGLAVYDVATGGGAERAPAITNGSPAPLTGDALLSSIQTFLNFTAPIPGSAPVLQSGSFSPSLAESVASDGQQQSDVGNTAFSTNSDQTVSQPGSVLTLGALSDGSPYGDLSNADVFSSGNGSQAYGNQLNSFPSSIATTSYSPPGTPFQAPPAATSSAPPPSGFSDLPPSYQQSSDNSSSSSDQYADNSDYYGGDDFGGGGGSTGFAPVVLDLSGKGINITQLSSSGTFFDVSGNGTENQTAWAGAGSGVLFYDPTGQGQLTQANQVVFTDWDPTASTDLQALEDVFDTNHDGSLDAGDADFANFFVMVTNADGTQTAVSLASLGITSINLTADTTDISLADGSSIDGETTYTTSSGTTGTAATVTFAADPNGYVIQKTTASNADGSTTIASVAENADGSIAYQTILNTQITTLTSEGVTTTATDKTLSTLNAGGVAETIQTDNSQETNDGSEDTLSETITNYEGGTVSASGELIGNGVGNAEELNATTTTTLTNSSGKTVTIDRDQLGGGWTTEREVDTYNASGSLASIVMSDLNPDGSASSVTTTTDTTSSGSSSQTVMTDVDGNSAYSTSTTDAITTDPGTKTETVTNYAGTTVTSLVTTVTETTSDSVTQTKNSDLTDGSTLDFTTVAQTVTNSDGSSTITQTDTSANNTLLDETVTTDTPQSSGGLVTQVTTAEQDGHGNFIEVGSQTTTISNAGATATTTVVDDSANGTQTYQSVTTSTVGSAAGSITIYGNGDGEITQSQTVAVDSGTTTDAVENLNGDGSLVDAAETITSSGGTSKISYLDETGAGTAATPTFDHETTDVTTTGADGSSTELVTDYGASTSNEIDQTKTVTSADGLTVTTYSDFTGAGFVADGTWDQITTDQTVVDSASQTANVTETVTTTDGYGNVLESVTKVTSADRRAVTTMTTLGTTKLVTTIETVQTEADGTIVDTVLDEDYNGDIIEATVTTTAADGLSKTVQSDVQGQTAAAYAADGLSFDLMTTQATTINADGSRVETTDVTSENGTLLSTASVTTNPNGFTVTTVNNPYATTDYATEAVDATTYNTDGSQTATASTYNYNGNLIDQTTTTASAGGLSTTVLYDYNGDGVVDQSSTDRTTINANGSQTEVVTDYTGGTNGTVRSITTTASGIIVAGAGLETEITTQSNGSVPTYEVETIMPSADGTTTDTTQYYAEEGGPLLLQTTVTTSANGLVKTTGTAVNGNTSNDFWTTDSTVLNANGSKTETVANYNKAGLISETVTTSSPNGLSTTTEEDADGAVSGSGAPVFNLTTTDNTVLHSDGSTTETVNSVNADGATIMQTVTTISADQQTIAIGRYMAETGNIETIDQSETIQTQSNGAIVDTTTSYGTSNQLLGTVVEETSGNGLETTTTYENASGNAVDAETETKTYDADGDGGTLDDFEDTDVVDGTNFTTSRKAQATGNDQDVTTTLILAGALAEASVANFSVVTTSDTAIADTGDITETIADTIGSATSPADTETVVTSASGLQSTTSVTLGTAATPYIVARATTNLDGSKTQVTTYYNPASLSRIEEQTTVNTSWDGRTVTTTSEADYDGTNYNIGNDTVVKNANETTTETISNTGSFGAPATSETITKVTNADSSITTTTLEYDGSELIGQVVADVSPDGLVKSFAYDPTGQESLGALDMAAADLLSGAALPSMLATDIIGVDTTTLNADGSTTEVIETAFGNSFANLRSETTTTASANGLSSVTDVDNDGNGVIEQHDTTTIAPDGSKTEVFDYYGDTSSTASTLEGSNTYSVSVNGLVTTLASSTGVTDTTVDFANSNGSYQWEQTVTSGSDAANAGYGQGSATHDIDANGIDTWTWNDGSSRGTSGTITIDVATENQDVSAANEIYETLLGQPMDSSQTQYLAQFITNGVLDRQGLAESIVNSSLYQTDYALPETVNNDQYTLLNGFDVDAAFENALGRLPTAEEASAFGQYISNPTPSNIAAMAVAVAQYAADLGQGNNRTALDLNQGLVSTNPIWINYATRPGEYVGSHGIWVGVGGGLTITGDFDSIFAESDSNTTVDGNNDTITAADDSTIGISGDDATINASAATVGLEASSSAAINGSNNAISLASGDALTVAGATNSISALGDNAITLGASSSGTISGSNNTVDMAAEAGATVDGTSNVVNAAGNNAIAFGAGSVGTVNGSNSTINLANGDSLTVNGMSNTIDAAGSNSITLGAASAATVDGSNNTISAATGDSLTVVGTSNVVDAVGNSEIAFGANSGGTVDGSDNTITLGSDANLTVSGINNSVDLSSGNTVTADGNGGSVTVVGAGVINVTASNQVVDASSGETINVSAGLSNVTIDASNATVNLGNGDGVTFLGNEDTVYGSDDTISLGDGLGASLNGNNNNVGAGSSDSITVSGDDNSTTVSGSNTILTTEGASNIGIANGNGDTMTMYGNGDSSQEAGANDVLYFEGSNQSGQLFGANEHGVAAGYDDNIKVSGNDDASSIIGDHDVVSLNGASDSGDLVGTNSVYWENASGSTVQFGGSDSGSAVYANAEGGGVTVNGSGLVDVLAANQDVRGTGNDTFWVAPDLGGVSIGADGSTIYTNDNDAIGVYGDNDNPNANYSDINIAVYGNNDAASEYGNGDVVSLNGSGDSDVLAGSNNVVWANAGNQVVNIDSSSDAVYANAPDGNTTINGSGLVDVLSSGQAIFTTGQETVWIAPDLNSVSVDGNVGDTVETNSGDYFIDQFYGSDYGDNAGDAGGEYDGATGIGYTSWWDAGGWTSGAAAGVTRQTNAVAQYDLGKGDIAAATASEKAWNRTEQAVAAASQSSVSPPPVFNGTKQSGPIVTWSLPESSSDSALPLTGSISDQYESLIAQAFQAWSQVTGLTFVQVAASDSSDIQLAWGNLDTAESGTVGMTHFDAANGQASDAFILLEDPSQDPLSTSPNGALEYSGTQTELYQTILHEIGHALGLGESSDPNSIMFPLLGANNTTLDSSDVQNAEALYGSGNGSAASLIQAMAAFGASTAPTSTTPIVPPAVSQTVVAANPMH